MNWLQKSTQKPLFWIIFIGITVGCLGFAMRYFSKALPIVNIDIKMDRTQAQNMASKLATKFGWGPQDYSQATSFDVDQTTKVFAELECGGQKTFINMMKEKLYIPYQWVVRHFREFEKNETYIMFTPDGIPYGFTEVISEDAKGANIEKAKAQSIAEEIASNHWGITFNDYKLAEYSKEVKTSKRADHSFVYERVKETLGKDGFYRLKIVVSGDKVTKVNHFVKIPEHFVNKYKEMRTSNNMIAHIASLCIMLLYLLGGCILGLYFLFKRGFVIWKAPLFFGAFVAFLFFLSQINVIPSAWMGYNTAISSQTFLIRYLISSFMLLLSKLFMFTISFMAAESLTRAAFGNHIQFWNTWSTKNASSSAVAGRTIAGYLLPIIMLAYTVGTYLIAQKFLGWWIPSGELINPNIVSHYLPWLSSFSNSLGAGFWEECLFRAVPLSCAALLGKKYGKQHWWIAIAFILQAIIFGAAHASYQAQPAYARLIELMLPSFMFAGVYLLFGLLPSIITHFVYDLILMSMPLFVSSSPYAWVNQLIVILLGLIPLIIVLISRLKAGKWSSITENDLNKSWRPPKALVKTKENKEIIQTSFYISKKIFFFIFALGIIGAAAWTYFTPFTHNATSLNISQPEAVTLAKTDMQTRGIMVSSEDHWQALPLLAGNFSYGYKTKQERKHPKQSRYMQHKFVWQHDKTLYKKLLGTYLNSPQWLVRFVKFTGNRAQRTEQYTSYINYIHNTSNLYRLSHKIPEERADKLLPEEQARIIAHTHLKQVFKIDPSKLKEVAATSHKLKNRINWEFIFSNKDVYPLDSGEARIAIYLDGDDVTDAYQYVHVPEQWLRQETNKITIHNILATICYLLVMLLLIVSILIAGKEIGYFSKRYAFIGAIVYFVMALILHLNNLSSTIATFDPIKPYKTQLFQHLGSLLVSTLFTSLMIGIIFGLISQYKTSSSFYKKINTFAASFLVGIFSVGIYALINVYKPSLVPVWPDFNALAGYSPAIGTLLSTIIQYITKTSFVILFVITLNTLYNSLSKTLTAKLAVTILCIVSSIAVHGIYEIDCIWFWLIKGTLIGLLATAIYLLYVRFDYATVPVITASIFIGNMLQQTMYMPYPNIVPLSVASVVIVICISIIWSIQLNTVEKK